MLKKTKLSKKTKRKLFIIKGLLIGAGVVTAINLVIGGIINIKDFTEKPLERLGILAPVSADVSYPNRAPKEKEYKYNEQVPVEEIKEEIVKQAKEFGNDPQFMLALAQCESTFNNLAENSRSSAEGIYQFLYGTWRETESGKNKISRFDYKANIREANIKIVNGEHYRWKDCVKKTNLLK